MGVILLVLAGILGATAYKFTNFVMSPASDGPQATVYYEVLKNASPYAVAQDLQKLGIVSNSFLGTRFFYWYGRLTGRTHRIKAGDYRFQTTMKPSEVYNILMSGISYGIGLTVPEGFNIEQISVLLEGLRPGSGQRFIALCHNAKFVRTLDIPLPTNVPNQAITPEGYLFPDTYIINRKTTEEEIIRNMVKKYRITFTPDMTKQAQKLGFSEHQIVTLASVIEKETGAAEERPKISSVFHNRLRKMMKLQSDPTVVYGREDFDGNIRKTDLSMPSPWNTYVIKGLPVGPIANPGKDALYAALHPDTTPYIFFVSHNDGTHEFTVTYKEHQNAVNKFQIDRRAREGKSWRDLKKAAPLKNQ